MNQMARTMLRPLRAFTKANIKMNEGDMKLTARVRIASFRPIQNLTAHLWMHNRRSCSLKRRYTANLEAMKSQFNCRLKNEYKSNIVESNSRTRIALADAYL